MTSEKQLETQEKVKMPWQGKVLIGFFSSGLVLFLFIAILALFLSDSSQEKEFFIFFVPIVFLLVFLIIFSLIQGWKWIVQIYFVIGSWDVLKNMLDVVKGMFAEDFDLETFLIDLVFLPVTFFFLYLIVACLKHPYFNQSKKLESNSSEKINQ